MRLLDHVAVFDEQGRFVCRGRIWGVQAAFPAHRRPATYDVLPDGSLSMSGLHIRLTDDRLQTRPTVQLKLVKGKSHG